MKSSATTIAVKKRKILRFTLTTVIEIISALFILLFVYTALSKLSEQGKFKWALGESILLSNYAGTIAWALPTVELLVALLLFIPRTRLWGLYASTVLMVIFTIYLGYMIAFDPKLPCSCGGVLQNMTWKQHLIFNVFFTLLAGTGGWLYRKKNRLLERESTHSVIYT
jgi:putative oxidoreductase